MPQSIRIHFLRTGTRTTSALQPMDTLQLTPITTKLRSIRRETLPSNTPGSFTDSGKSKEGRTGSSGRGEPRYLTAKTLLGYSAAFAGIFSAVIATAAWAHSEFIMPAILERTGRQTDEKIREHEDRMSSRLELFIKRMDRIEAKIDKLIEHR